MGRAVTHAQEAFHSRGLGEPTARLASLLGVLVLVGLPLAAVLAGATRDSLALLREARPWQLFLETLAFALAITVTSVTIGVPLGALFARARVRARALLLLAHTLPLLLPPLVVALGWFHLLGEHGIVGTPLTASLLFSRLGACALLASSFAPAVTWLTMAGVLSLDASIEEAATLVAPPRTALLRIVIPAARRHIALGALIVLALSLAEVGVPMFLRVNVYGASVFARLGGTDFAPHEAAALSLPMIIVGVAFAWFARHTIPGSLRLRGDTHTFVELGPWPTALGIAAALLAIAPIAALARTSWPGLRALGSWLGAAPSNSMVAAVAAAVVSTILAIVLGHTLVRYPSRLSRVLDAILLAGFFVPSTVIGVGLQTTWNRASTSWIYGTAAIVTLGFCARYSSIAVRIFAASVGRDSVSYEHAASLVGAGFWGRLVGIVVPMNAKGLVVTFALVLVSSLRDLETAIVAYPPGGETLTVRLFTLEANGPPSVVAGLALVQIGLTLGVLGTCAMIFRRLR